LIFPATANRHAGAGFIKQFVRDKLIDHREHIPRVGDDLPEIKSWTWTGATGNSVLPPS